jgi:hypothetical protein
MMRVDPVYVRIWGLFLGFVGDVLCGDENGCPCRDSNRETSESERHLLNMLQIVRRRYDSALDLLHVLSSVSG